MLEEEKKLVEEIPYFADKQTEREYNSFRKKKRRYFFLSIFLSLAIISSIYLLLNESNVKNINVNGNIYLHSEDIIAQAHVSKDDKYIFTFPSRVKKDVLQNPLIEDCEVLLLDDNTVEINIREKKIIAYSIGESSYIVVLADDTRINLDSNNMYLIEKVPFIEGFLQEDLLLIEKNLSDLDYKLINEISEIHYYPDLKYQYVEIIMRDGNYIFTSPYGLSILNKYYDIESSYGKSSDSCFYFEDISGNAYASSCPWQENVTEEVEVDLKESN